MPAGTLLVVATPLGNLDDISPRGLAALKRAWLVACEDTRRTRGLLERYGIKPPRVISCHRFNESRQAATILAALKEGKDVALVSDGGTPGLSDPGAALVEAALSEGLPVCPIPGPSAVAAAVSASGFAAASFFFAGFLPPRSGLRRKSIEALAHVEHPLVVFEAPHRVAATARDLLALLGDRPVTLLREMTKLHEEVRRTTLGSLARELEEAEPRGEYTLVIQGSPKIKRMARRPAGADADPLEAPPGAGVNRDDLLRRYRTLLASGADRREALKSLVRETGLPRRDVYAAVRGAKR